MIKEKQKIFKKFRKNNIDYDNKRKKNKYLNRVRFEITKRS
jgi:hypothetical protein